jgi:hypothetical protein
MDYSRAVDLIDEPLNIELNALVERAAAKTMELPRSYLGASIIGHECDREVQFAWWVRPLLPARVKSIFARGHFFEARIREQLIDAGFAFAPAEALEFSALGGALAGHADGIIIAAPAMPGIHFPLPAIWEAKALNAKNWRAVARDDLAKVFPKYAVQVAVYQYFLGKPNAALITCVNADTCEVLHFSLPFNATRAALAIERAERIVAATRAGELLPRFTDNPNDLRCRLCNFRPRCWGTP